MADVQNRKDITKFFVFFYQFYQLYCFKRLLNHLFISNPPIKRAWAAHCESKVSRNYNFLNSCCHLIEIFNKKKEKFCDKKSTTSSEYSGELLTSLQLAGVGLIFLHDLSNLLTLQWGVQHLIQPGVSLHVVDEVHELVQREEWFPLRAAGGEREIKLFFQLGKAEKRGS